MPIIKDSDTGWRRKAKACAVATALLFATGVVTSVVERPVWQQVKATQPELNLSEIEGALGQGLVLGLFGGFRTIIADFLFIRANTYWEKRDRPNTETLLNLVTAVDPHPMFFWLNGARMMAYDMPAWEVRERGGFGNIPESVKQRIFADYAQLGLNYIDKAARFHPNDYRIPLEKAQIHVNRLEDPEGAARYYKEVTGMDNAPFFANRIYAEMLKRAGRNQEAYDYLRTLYPTLPEDNPMAARDVVLDRMRELEDQLDMPALRRFPTQPGERLPATIKFPAMDGSFGWDEDQQHWPVMPTP